jgi:hypothetical protein
MQMRILNGWPLKRVNPGQKDVVLRVYAITC